MKHIKLFEQFYNNSSSLDESRDDAMVYGIIDLLLKVKDIENYSVLKGESATALYGSKASNGVIIIITKKALQELTHVKTRTNFNETAFFYPHLTTDKEGVVAFNFKTPESLTKWKKLLWPSHPSDSANIV